MPRKKIIVISSIIAAVAVAAIVIFKVGGKNNTGVTVNPAFSPYISAFTSGVISSESVIKIRLANDYSGTMEVNKPVEEELFDFDPNIEGTTVWVDKRTIEFHPKEKLPHKKTYVGHFYISKLMEMPKDLQTFDFPFQVIEQSFDVTVNGMKAYDKKELRLQKLMGTIYFSDFAGNDEVEKVLEATQDNKKLTITWTHEADRKTHQFQVDSIIRKDKAGEVLLKWDGKVVDSDVKGEQKVEVPALGDFKVVSVHIEQKAEQYVAIQFSDPLLEKQNLDGLIRLGNLSNLRFTINDNEIWVYPAERQIATHTLQVDAGVKNSLGFPLKTAYSEELTFEEIKPGVRLVGKGVILPNSNGLNFPFEAVNLSAIHVKIIKIFENNIMQFLQVNALDGQYELKRVGRIVLQKTIPLEHKNKSDYATWKHYSIDLAELIKAEPGAIYRVVLSFSKKHSLYHCDGDTTATPGMEELSDDVEDNTYSSNWDYYQDSYYEDYYYEDGEYNWQDRDNPCSPSYYTASRSVSRNILASDVGLIAKTGADGNMLFVVSDLKTTKPISGTTLEIYNFQQQLMASGKTDGDGYCKMKFEKKPYLLIAKNGDQRGYLKLDDASSLSLSSFDVSGEAVQKGIKGFIYGERGVWRPGDSLYLNFILEDKNNTLPPNHPVSLELSNPQGQVVIKMLKTISVNGFYNFNTATSPDAPTGNWMAKVKVGGATFTKTIKIETIMPNRLKINLDFGKDLLTKGKSENGKLTVKWLHGAIAKNLKADIDVTLTATKTVFDKYKNYNFDDPARTFSSEKQTLFDGTIDEKGEASISSDISVADAAGGMLKANFMVRAFEEGGNFSVDRFSIPYSPYTSYVGALFPEVDKMRGMIFTDQDHTINIVTVDEKGNPVSRDVKVDVYKLEWRWWWDRTEDELANYVGSSYHQPIQTTTIATRNGKGEFNFRINKPEWGRYYIHILDPISGHSTGNTVYVDWPDWSSRAQKDGAGGATMLSFTADKEKYNVGEKVHLTIPSSGMGNAIISIESGSKVIKTYWQETKESETNFEFEATAEMTPNIYVNVSLLQPHAQTKNDLPIRMYGVIPILVEDPETHLNPVLKMPDVLMPEQKTSLSVSEKDGKAMAYTVAIVDEGLLDLTKFKTPDAWNNFYAREALGVKTWDLYDLVMGAYGAELEKILSIGGDEFIKGKEGAKANRFKPMVKFFGPFYLKKGETKTHNFEMPLYIGSVRAMVIAGDQGAYGQTEKTVPVRKPLMVLGTLPRVLGPGESVKLPVTVFAMEKKIKDVSVEIVANNLFSIEGDNKKNISFAEIGDDVVNFDLKVKSVLGVGKVKIIAKSAGEKAEFEVELDVRNPNPPVSDVVEMVIEAGQKWNTTYKPLGMAGTNKGTLELSSVPPLNLEKRLQYLIQYPHGCIEQTTSSVFPQLYLSNLLEINTELKARIEQNTKAALIRLRSFQLANGGFSYWPGDPDANAWGSNYAGHFILEAESKGYTLPVGMKENWKKYQVERALSWTNHNDYYDYDLSQAYRLYTLALAGVPELSAMNRLREQKDLSVGAKWRLAAAYQLAGQPEAAKAIISNLSTESKSSTYHDYYYYSYGSEERDDAMILETMSIMKDKTKAIPMVKAISKALCNNQWMSTQTAAYCLLAMSKFVGNDDATADLSFAYKINNGSKEKVNTRFPMNQVDLKINGVAGGSLEVENNSKGVLFARVVMQGIPETGDQTDAASNLTLDVVYKNKAGLEIDPTELEQGTDFTAEVTITNPGERGEYRDMALAQVFPSGWEIHNTRFYGPSTVAEPVEASDGTSDDAEETYEGESEEGEGDADYDNDYYYGTDRSVPKITYQDFRDDRVYSYFHLRPGKSITVTISLNAAYIGKYYLPTISCEAMYDNTISARKAGKWISVVDEKKPSAP